jgi:hypothetical protein
MSQEWETDGTRQKTVTKSGWMVCEDFAIQNGRRIVRKLTIEPRDDIPPGGITARLLRTIKIGQLASGLRQKLRQFHDEGTAGRVFDEMNWSAQSRRRPRPRYSRATDAYYLALAQDYVRLCSAGERTPVSTLAKQRKVQIVRVRSHINLARRNGFLTDTSRGKPGGTLTEKARRVLGEKEAPPDRKR